MFQVGKLFLCYVRGKHVFVLSFIFKIIVRKLNKLKTKRWILKCIKCGRASIRHGVEWRVRVKWDEWSLTLSKPGQSMSQWTIFPLKKIAYQFSCITFSKQKCLSKLEYCKDVWWPAVQKNSYKKCELISLLIIECQTLVLQRSIVYQWITLA